MAVSFNALSGRGLEFVTEIERKETRRALDEIAEAHLFGCCGPPSKRPQNCTEMEPTIVRGAPGNMFPTL